LSIGSDESVHADELVKFIEFLHGVTDVTLVGLEVNDEGESVVIFNLSHGRIGAQGKLDNRVLSVSGSVGDTLLLVLGVTLKTQSLRATELSSGVDAALGLRVDTTLGGLGSLASLDEPSSRGLARGLLLDGRVLSGANLVLALALGAGLDRSGVLVRLVSSHFV